MLTGCREYRALLIELARGEASGDERRLAMAHVEICEACARALDGQLALSAALDGMAGEELPEMAAIEGRVLAEFDRSTARRVRNWVVLAALAAAVCLGVVWVERRHPVERPVARAEIAPIPAALAATPVEAGHGSMVQRVQHRVSRRKPTDESQPFVPIPYTVPLSPEERTTVIRMQISVAALIAIGFSVPAADPEAVFDADVLVSQDGRARAIRLISIAVVK